MAHSSSASGTSSGRRVDLRWSRVSLAQLQDEEFLIKQLRRLQSLDAFSRKRRHATGAPTDRDSRHSSSVFSTPLPSRLSLQARQARGPAPPPTGDAMDAEDPSSDKRSLNADASSEQETEAMNALYVLGSLDQPELTALMMRQLKDLLARNCSFVDPFSTLVALRKHIVENMHAAVVAQHQQHQAAVIFMEKLMANARLESASSAGNCQSSNGLPVDTSPPAGDALSIKPKEKGIREAAVGVRFVLSVLTSMLDLSCGSPPQKREFLGELLPLVASLTPLSLAPKQPESHAAANSELDRVPSMGSNVETQELVERLQQFFLHLCAGVVRQGPTSPKVLAVASSADRDLTDRTQAMNGLIHLAAARGSLRDFLLVLKVILGVSEMSIGDYKDAPAPTSPRTCVQSPPALSSQLTASAPLLKTTRYDQESGLVSDNNTPQDLKADTMTDMNSKSTKPSRIGDSDPTSLGVSMEATNLVQQVKRKALPKGFVPKVVGTTSTMAMVNHAAAVHPSSMHRLLSSTEAIIDIMPTAPPRSKSRMKEDNRDLLLHGNLNLSFDLSMIQPDAASRRGEPTARFTRRDPVVTARCPKFKPLDVASVLQELDHAKPCAFSRITSNRIHRSSHNNPEDSEIRAAAFVGLGDEDSDDREVWSCGQNSYGELGHGDTTTRNTFERIESLQRKDVIQVSAGNEHSIALCADGSVWTCGYNDNGQCGHGTTTRVVHMSEITKIGDQLIAQVHAYNGCEHTILVTQDGKVATCGYNYRGQLGHGSTTSEPIPKIVRSLETKQVRLVSCSYYHTMMTCDGDGGRDIVYTFGRNDYGQLGHDDTVDRKVPQQVDALSDRRIVSVACGQYHSMVVTAAGRVFAFGKNDYGQLGLDTIDNQLVPAQIKGGLEKQTCLEIRCGYYHSIVLCSGARIYGFGRNDYGQLGLGRSNATASANIQLQQQRFALPQLIEELEGKDIARIACGCYHTVVVCEDGMLYVFGRNNHGQLGTGDTNERLYPFPVDDFVGKHVATVAAGFYHTMVLTGNKEEGKCEDANENEMEDFAKTADLKSDMITHSSILSSASCRRILTGKSNMVENDTVNNPTCDGEDDKRDEDDGVEDRARKNTFPKSCDESYTHLAGSSPGEAHALDGGADSLEVSVIIMAELDRLCRPFIPKNGVYPILQYPAIQTMESILTCLKPTSVLNTCELFSGCFELYAIDVCSSTFTSLCLLLKNLSFRTFEYLSQTHFDLQGLNAPSASRSTSNSAKSAQLQLYMIMVCLRLLQANLAQCLRSGCAKAMLLYADAKEFNNAEGSSGTTNAEIENMIAALPHIRETLFMLIDLKYRRAPWLTTDSKNEYSNDETAARIAEEATDTLMIAFELLFPCQCSQMKLFEFVIGYARSNTVKSDSLDSVSCRYCRHIIWRPDSLSKSRKFLLTPLLKRLADDSLMLKLLPILPITGLSMPGTRKQSLQYIVSLYTGVLEYVAVDFTRIVGSSDINLGTQLGACSRAKDSSYNSSFTLLLAIGKYVSSWASSCHEWKVSFKIPDELSFEERLSCLVDRVLHVDESDLNHLPASWHCFLEFSSAILMECCDVILQVLSREPVPSPTFGNRVLSSRPHESLKSLSLELLELSLVGKLLPSLISSLLAFSGNSLFSATLLPKINDLLRLVDEFNRSCDGKCLIDLKNKFTDTIMTPSPLSPPVNPRSNTECAKDVTPPRPCLSGVTLDVREKRISDTMSLPWSFLLEKKLAKLAAEMIVTLVKGDPFFSLDLFESNDKESIPSRWLSNSIFKGGLDPDFIRQSVSKTQESTNSICGPEFRIVRHLPFQQSEYNGKATFSLILPPPGNEYKSYVAYPAIFSSTGSAETYLHFCTASSIRGFLRALSSDLPVVADHDWTSTRQFCDWIRDHYSRTDATYRMLVRTRPMNQNNQVSVSQTEMNMEYAFFADLVHHNDLSLVALHWSLRHKSSHFNSSRSPPPRIFIELWRYVAELRRRFATKKTELKMALPIDDTQISRLQQIILERCQLLLLLKASVHDEYSHINSNGGFIAAHDPAISSSYEIASERSVKRHMASTYTTMELPFLIAYPKSKWRIVRVFVHVITRWRMISKSTPHLENGIMSAHELLDFVTADEKISTLSALNIVLVDPCRRASCSAHGFEYLSETLSLITFESIQVDILHHTSHSLVFDGRHAIQSVVSNGSQHVGSFYSSLRSDALVDFLVQVTDMIVEQSTQLLGSGSQDDRVWFLCILLSCWGTHFETNQFKFVSDTGILTVLQELSLAITNIMSQASQSQTSADIPVNGATVRISDSINGLFISDHVNLMSKALSRLKDVLWTLFRYICVHFSVRHIHLNGLSKSDMICTPIRPLLSSIFDLLYSAMTVMIQDYFSPSSTGDECSLSLTSTPDQIKLYEMCALLLPLALSSEGQFEFRVNGARWLQILWSAFLHAPTLRLQQALLRVMRVILKLHTPRQASDVLLSLNEYDAISLLHWGFEKKEDIFVQQIIRMIGFCVSQCPAVQESESINEQQQHLPEVPIALTFANGVHGNIFCAKKIYRDFDDKRTIGGPCKNKPDRFHSFAIGNELLALLQDLQESTCGNTKWNTCIQRTLLRCLAVDAKTEHTDCSQSKSAVRIGCGLAFLSDIKNLEMVGSLYCFSGPVDTLRSGAIVELVQTGERAQVVSLVGDDKIRADRKLLNSAIFCPQRDKSVFANVVIQNNGFRPHAQYRNQLHSHVNSAMWFEQVMVHLVALESHGNTPYDMTSSRYAQLSLNDVQPALEYSPTFIASNGKNFVNRSDLIDKLLQYALKTGSEFLCSPLSTQITDKYLVEVQTRCFALKALVQIFQADYARHECLSNEHLISMIMESGMADDGIDAFTTLEETERNLWMLRERIFNILADLEDEWLAELKECGNSYCGVVDLAHDFQSDSAWISDEDTDSSKKIGQIEIPYINAIENSEELCESGEDDTGDLQEEPMDRDLVYTEREDEDEDAEDNENDEEDENEDEDDENDNEEVDDAEESRAEFVDELMLMGFPEEWCVLALKQTENDIVSASAWIVDNLEYLSRLQSSLDQQRDQGINSPMCNEEDDVNTGDDALNFDLDDGSRRPLIPDYTQDANMPTHGVNTDENLAICEDYEQLVVPPPVNDKEMGRKVFGEMYFPFEDGGFDSNMKSFYMYSWRSSTIETQLAAEANSIATGVESAENASAETLEPLVPSRTQFAQKIRQMDLCDLMKLLQTYERAFSVLYARLCAVSIWAFTVPALNLSNSVDVSLPTGLTYHKLFALLKVVLHRGEQFSSSINQSIKGNNTWITKVMESVVCHRLKLDFEAFSYAVVEFCISELERAASTKVYEAFLWTQREFKRVDRVVMEEPAVEIVGWLTEKLFQDNVALLSPHIVTQTLLRLRYCLKSSNLPLKFIILQTMSRILRQQLRKDSNGSILTDGRIYFDDFFHAAKQRYVRELVQNRLLFSRYLQAYIEILHLISAVKQLLRDVSQESEDSAQPILNPTAFRITPQTQSTSNSSQTFVFDRKRCRSSLLTISADDLSVVYSGHEIWKTVFGTVCCCTGVTSWQVRIEKSSSSYLFVGVASHRASADSFLGADEHSWGYIGDKALYYQRNRVKSYGEGFGEGDIIGVRVDSEQGTLSFSKNGVDLGIAFENIVGDVYPAVSFHTRHQKVSIIPGAIERFPVNRKDELGAGLSISPDSDLTCDSKNTRENLNECGSIEECLLVCEMMNWMVNNQCSLRPQVLRSAYEMTQQWLLGSKKYVTTRAGKPLWVYVTKEVCVPFGFQAQDRVRTPRGNGNIAGVADSRIWVDVDGEDGAWFFHPSKLRPLTIISVSNVPEPFKSVNTEADTSSKIADSTLLETKTDTSSDLSDLSYEHFTEKVREMHWNLKIDRVLLSLVNDRCDSSSISPWNVSRSDLLGIVRSKSQELLAAVEAQFPNVVFSMQKLEGMCIVRMGFLRFFNAYFSRVISYFDMTWHYFSPKASLLPCHLASKCRGSIFTSIKNELFTSLMEKTANAPKKADDDYDYPDDLPQLLINRPKAATAKCHPGSLKSLFLSIFGQAFDQLHFLPVKMIRMVYSHPMDDGQLRSFKVKFEGEGVDDYGGPYREFFSQFFADLQMLRESSTDDGTDPEKAPKDSTPTSCLLPFLIPSPNWRNGVGANREKFVLNAALIRNAGKESVRAQKPAEKDLDESDTERRQVHAEMFHFFGQMLGTCLRTRVCVRLDLAISVWQQLVGEDSDADRDTSLQTLKEVDFPAYTLWKSLYEMHEQYKRHFLSSGSGQICQDLREQLEVMDLSFTTFLSDGQEVELCAHGADKSVTMDNVDEYLDAVLTERIQEARDVISIMKQGINTVLPVTALSLLTWQELEKRVCGVADVDVNLLRRNTEYDEDLSPGDEFVQRFWRVLESMEEDDKRAFLRFVWARSRLPVGAAQFHQKFKLQSLSPLSNRNGTESASTSSTSGNFAWMDSQLPKSHTCFFALQLPRYSSDEICRKQLLYAIRNCVEMDGDFRLADTEMTGWSDINPNDQLRF